MLLHTRSIYSNVSNYFSSGFDLFSDFISVPIHVSMLVGEHLVVKRAYRSYPVSLFGYDTWVDMIILKVVDLDVILSMDCLS